MSDFFPGFEQRQIETSGATINLVTGGSGPPLLLLHGYPQTHVMWRKVAPRLAEIPVDLLQARLSTASEFVSVGRPLGRKVFHASRHLFGSGVRKTFERPLG